MSPTSRESTVTFVDKVESFDQIVELRVVSSEQIGLGRFNPSARRFLTDLSRPGGEHEQVAGADNSHYYFEHTSIGP